MQKTLINISPEAQRFFFDRKCPGGVIFIYYLSMVAQYHLEGHGFPGEINLYYNPQMGRVVMLINFLMSTTTIDQRQIAGAIDALIIEDVKKQRNNSDYSCIFEQGLHIPIFYSFLGKPLS